MHRDRFRCWMVRNAQLVIFLASYTFTVVLGNLLYATPLGRPSLAVLNLPTTFLDFPGTFSLGFWLLLALPFAVAPPIATWVRRASAIKVSQLARSLPDFRSGDYVLLTAAVYVFLLVTFWRSGAFQLTDAGADFVSSLEARYALRTTLGPLPLIALQAVLPFLAVYSVVRALQSRTVPWTLGATANVVATTGFLVCLNTKWPALLFLGGVVLAIFLYAPRAPYLMTAAGTLVVGVAYVAIAAYVFRINPPKPNAPPRPTATVERSAPATHTAPPLAARVVVAASNRYVLLAPIHRMALPYPYYYDVFTREGHVCGGLLEQAQPGPKCRPSTLIYERAFASSKFHGRGTAPAAVHISGYALGGWPLALAGLTLASAILGLFAALPIDSNAMTGTLGVTGALAGYHFSQIPGEGVIFYEHGLIWIALVLGAYIAVRLLTASRAGTARCSPH